MSSSVIVSRTYVLHPNKQMRDVLDRNMDYRRKCWNNALEIWQDMYDARDLMLDESTRLLIAKYYRIKISLNSNRKMKSKTVRCKQAQMKQIYDQVPDESWELAKINPSPSWRKVRDIMVNDKSYHDLYYSSRILQLAVQDLGKAFEAFFEKSQKRQGMPKFRSYYDFRQGFKTDTARIVNGSIRLDQPKLVKEHWSLLKLNEPVLSNRYGVMSFYKEKGQYYVSIPFKINVNDLKQLDNMGRNGAIDRNVKYFVSTDAKINVLPKRLNRLYKRVKHYQRQLAKKRNVNGKVNSKKSHNYQKIQHKLQITYTKIHNIQHDLMHKFTTSLIKQYDKIVIENLNVSAMKMSHVASKGMQRSMFGLFSQLLQYKCNYYQRELILADPFYPSTQRCSYCGSIKKKDEKVTLSGNKKHHTSHDEYICYNPDCPMFNKKQDRDENAARNLLALIQHPELNCSL